MTSMAECYLVFAPPRLRKGLDVGYNCLKEIRKRPLEKTRRWRRAIRSATIEVRQDGPHLGSPLGQSTMIVRHLRQRAGAPCDRRRGTLQGVDPVGRPRVPIRKDLWSESLGDGMLGNRGSHRFPCRLPLGLASATTGASHLVVPIDHGQEALVHPLPPPRRPDEPCPILMDALPPEIHEGSQGRPLLAARGHGVGTGGELMALSAHFDRLNRRLQLACDLCGGLRSRVCAAEWMQRERESLSEAPIGVVPLFPSRALGLPCGHQRLGLWSLLSRLGPSLESCQSLLSFREFLVRLSHAPAKGPRIALDDRMHEVEAIGYTAALQPLFGELNQGLGPVTDQGEDVGSQGLEPLIHPRFPRGRGPILGHLFQPQLSRCQIQKDQNHLF